jgi:hypothetical protein
MDNSKQLNPSKVQLDQFNIQLNYPSSAQLKSQLFSQFLT